MTFAARLDEAWRETKRAEDAELRARVEAAKRRMLIGDPVGWRGSGRAARDERLGALPRPRDSLGSHGYGKHGSHCAGKGFRRERLPEYIDAVL